MGGFHEGLKLFKQSNLLRNTDRMIHDEHNHRGLRLNECTHMRTCFSLQRWVKGNVGVGFSIIST